jgi:phosphatidylethanolamine-binding protein (PEBP) family uncharacterized protein
MGAGPPQGTKLHRYVFLLYRQHGAIHMEKMDDDGMGRANFKIKDWAKKHNLGHPIGATFYQAQNK